MYQLCKRNKKTGKKTYSGKEQYADRNSLQILIDYWNTSHKDDPEEMYMKELKK